MPTPVSTPGLYNGLTDADGNPQKPQAWPYDSRPGASGYSSFSGADAGVYAFMSFPGAPVSKPVQLMPQTISVSSFREKVPVRGLGNTNVIGFTRGPRTFAGSMIYTVIHAHPLKALLEIYGQMRQEQPDLDLHNFSYDERIRLHTQDNRGNPDGLPPITFLIDFANEFGNRAAIVIHGVEFVNDGTTVSIEDPFTENTYQYIARDIFVLTDSSTEEGIKLPSPHDWLGVFGKSTGWNFDNWSIAGLDELDRETLSRVIWTATNSFDAGKHGKVNCPVANPSKNYTNEPWVGYKPSVGP